ncbi:MAG: DNA polymerase III subunit chi, partial [Caldimonas sp.]
VTRSDTGAEFAADEPMTEIRFHFNVPSRTGYACRLLRKAARQGSAIALTGPQDLLARLDRELWDLGPAEFVAHAWAGEVESVPASLHSTTVWLAPDPLAAPVHGALVNLGDAAPRGFETFERLIEVVSTDPGDRTAARERWKGYAGRGYSIDKHEVTAP